MRYETTWERRIAGVRRARNVRKEAGESMTKVVVSGAVAAFLIFYIMTSPAQAADIFHSGWHSVVSMAHGVGDFVDKLAS
jgi:hypothetical protein